MPLGADYMGSGPPVILWLIIAVIVGATIRNLINKE